MISNQILQSTIEGLKNITRKELSVVEKEGKVIATTEENMIGRQIDAVENFVGSQAESQLILGYQYFGRRFTRRCRRADVCSRICRSFDSK